VIRFQIKAGPGQADSAAKGRGALIPNVSPKVKELRENSVDRDRRFGPREPSLLRPCSPFSDATIAKRRFPFPPTVQGRGLYCHSVRRGRGETPLGEFRPILRQEQRVFTGLLVQNWLTTDEYIFRVVTVDTDKNNGQPANGADRRFILAEEEAITVDKGDLIIRFKFRSDAERCRQDTLNAASIKAILEAPAASDWVYALAAHETVPGRSGPPPFSRDI